MNSTSVGLLDRLKQPNNAEAWDRFVELYTPLLYHWVRKAGLGEEDAADLVQDVLTTLLEKLPHFVYDRDKSFHAWLRTVTMNRWRDLAKRKSVILVQRGGQPISDTIVPDPLESFIEREYRGRLAAHALELLKTDFQPHVRQVFWELVVENQPAQEVAARHRLTLGALYAIKCRVIHRLRQELRELWF